MVDTFRYIDAQIKVEEVELRKLEINRLNTYYIVKSNGVQLRSPDELYKLPTDKNKFEAIDLMSEEANKLFDKFTID